MSDSEEDSDVESKTHQAETEAPGNETTSPRRTTRTARQPTQLYQPASGEGPPKKRKRKMKVGDEVGVMEEEKDKEEASEGDDSDKGGNDSSGDADDDDDSAPSPPMKRKRGRKRSLPNLSDAELTCSHCQKKFTVKPGLDYHVNKFVCRPTLRPGGPVVKGKRKKSASSGGGTKAQTYLRIRGKLEDRTCPKCKRVFTSILGLSYHLGTLIKCIYSC
jgi:uncharacterized Zn-finger protein